MRIAKENRNNKLNEVISSFRSLPRISKEFEYESEQNLTGHL